MRAASFDDWLLFLPWLIGGAIIALLLPLLQEFGYFAILGMIGVGVGAVALALHPLVCFTLYFSTLFVADNVVPGLGISANQIFGLLFLASFGSFWFRGHALRLQSGLLPVLLVVCAYFGVNAAMGESVERGPVHAKYVVVYLIVAICLAKTLSTERAILAFAAIITGTTLLAALAGLGEAVQKGIGSGIAGKWTDAVRVKGFARNSIQYGWNILFAFPFAFLLFAEASTARRRLGALAAGMVILFVAMLTFNRQTLITMIIVVTLCAIFIRYQHRRVLVGLMCGIGVIAAATVLPMIVNRLLTVSTIGKDPSYLEHRDSILSGMEMFKAHPVFGIGLGSFPTEWKRYMPEDLSTYYSQYYEATRIRYPDFGYMGLLAETGIVGECLFVTLLIVIGWRAWRIRRIAREMGDRFAENLAGMVLVVLGYLVITTAGQDTFLYPRVWMFYAVAMLLDERILGLTHLRSDFSASPETAISKSRRK